MFFAASILLSCDESTPMTKHRVGLLEERITLGPSHSRNISLTAYVYVYIQAFP